MSGSYCYLFVAALVSVSAQQDDICPIVGLTDLTNLVTVALNSMSQGTSTMYQILEYQVVCLAQGAGKDQYRMTSVIVVYQEVGGTTQFIGQFQFLCENAEWSANLGGLGNVVSTGQPTGNLSTTVRTDCRFCSDISNSTSDEHCFVCPANCANASRCDMSGNCCNLFSLSGACASQCPGNSTINSEFQCTCDRGYTSNSNNTECVDVDECASTPCLNNGTCQDGRGDFACLCHDGFSGETCETCNVPFCRTFNNTGKCGIQNCLNCPTQDSCTECESSYQLAKDNSSCDDEDLDLLPVYILVPPFAVALILLAALIVFAIYKKCHRTTEVRPF